jgi:predicted HicB family RNase H-like nuclease
MILYLTIFEPKGVDRVAVTMTEDLHKLLAVQAPSVRRRVADRVRKLADEIEPSDEKISRRKPGRPRKYGQGRINATVRFTPERHAELRAAADQNGRSVSEQVEYLIERASTIARGADNP